LLRGGDWIFLFPPKGRGLNSLISPLSKGGLRGVKYPTFYGILPHPNPPLAKGTGFSYFPQGERTGFSYFPPRGGDWILLFPPKGRGLDSFISPQGEQGVFIF